MCDQNDPCPNQRILQIIEEWNFALKLFLASYLGCKIISDAWNWLAK